MSSLLPLLLLLLLPKLLLPKLLLPKLLLLLLNGGLEALLESLSDFK
jgi:hypothetical protein